MGIDGAMDFRVTDTFSDSLAKLTGEKKEILASLRKTHARSHRRERHLSHRG